MKGLTLKELAILYRKAKVFVYPSIYEGFGIPIIEALYSKTPVITSIGGVFPEAGGPNTIYIDPKSVLDLENEIKNLLENEILRDSITEEGLKFVQKFNDEIIARNYFEIYKELNS